VPISMPAARALGCGGCTSFAGAWAPCARGAGARDGRVRVFLGGALRCLVDSETPDQPPPKNNQKMVVMYVLRSELLPPLSRSLWLCACVCRGGPELRAGGGKKLPYSPATPASGHTARGGGG
jgi:hypothetical protein